MHVQVIDEMKYKLYNNEDTLYALLRKNRKLVSLELLKNQEKNKIICV
jgi:hypothetical protein